MHNTEWASNMKTPCCKRSGLAVLASGSLLLTAASNAAASAPAPTDFQFLGSASQVRSQLLGNTPMQFAEADSKSGEGKCGEGKCGGDKKEDSKAGEGKCGEGKCGGDAKHDSKAGEGKCGEGKCGGGKE